MGRKRKTGGTEKQHVSQTFFVKHSPERDMRRKLRSRACKNNDTTEKGAKIGRTDSGGTEKNAKTKKLVNSAGGGTEKFAEISAETKDTTLLYGATKLRKPLKRFSKKRPTDSESHTVDDGSHYPVEKKPKRSTVVDSGDSVSVEQVALEKNGKRVSKRVSSAVSSVAPDRIIKDKVTVKNGVKKPTKRASALTRVSANNMPSTESPVEKSSKKQAKRVSSTTKPVAASQGTKQSTKSQKSKPKRVIRNGEGEDSSSSESEWEDVETVARPNEVVSGPSTSAAASHKVSESIEIPLFKSIKSKKELDEQTLLRRELNRFLRKQHEEVHKAHLLGYIAHGLKMSDMCNDGTVRACALSLVPEGFLNVTRVGLDIPVLQRFWKWFRSAFRIGPSESVGIERKSVMESLMLCLERKSSKSCREIALAAVSILRLMGLDIRLVVSVWPISLQKPPGIVATTSATQAPSTSKAPAKKVPKSKQTQKPTDKEDADRSYQPDYWTEVYLELEERWICMDFLSGCVNDPTEIEKRCKHKLHYVLGFDNDGGVKDVTSRYCATFHAQETRRARVDAAWWKRTLWKFRSPHRRRDRAEDLQLHDALLDRPMPSKISEFKNHPLYALKRDLKKFEALYPEDTQPVGEIRGEPVYPRSAIRALHCKESWLKEARIIREGEEAYKIVKARPKMGVPKDQQPEDRPLPLFGFWQTDPYTCPSAENGIVPKNEYGNVYMFQPSMLPPGTVHLHVPGLFAIAKKLNIDCAAAIVGWDFHGCRNHPVMEGWIVCAEHQDTLLDAWNQNEAIQDQKQQEKIKERAIQNWKRLTKTLLLRKIILKKFLNSAKSSKLSESMEETLEEQAADDSKLAWPQNRQDFLLNLKK